MNIETAPAIGPDGTVYTGNSDHLIYAIYGSDAPAASAWPMFRHDAQNTGRI